MRALVLAGVFVVGCNNDFEINREVNVESFAQPARAEGVDILWIVDDSASMFEEQAQLELHADSFISYLSAVPVDFRLGVTSTDLSVDEPGVLVGDVLSPETPGLSDAFAAQIRHDEDGSRDEMGFEAAILAADPDGVNSGFNRTAADLEVIFFTDEDDNSELDALGLLEALEAGRDGGVVVNSVVGDPPSGCASLEAAADAGVKYIEAQELSLGLRESICALDYGAMLERVALRVLGMETHFYLAKVPSPASMEVIIDGAHIPSRERHGWQYEPGINAIVFDGYAVPRPGAEVVVRYYDWLGPAMEDDQTYVDE